MIRKSQKEISLKEKKEKEIVGLFRILHCFVWNNLFLFLFLFSKFFFLSSSKANREIFEVFESGEAIYTHIRISSRNSTSMSVLETEQIDKKYFYFFQRFKERRRIWENKIKRKKNKKKRREKEKRMSNGSDYRDITVNRVKKRKREKFCNRQLSFCRKIARSTGRSFIPLYSITFLRNEINLSNFLLKDIR